MKTTASKRGAMHLDFMKQISLKTKMALAVTGLFLLYFAIAACFSFIYFERAFKESIFTQQSSLVASNAANIDNKLRIALNALVAVAATAPRDAFTNPDSSQRFLDKETALLSIFDNGIFFIDKNGILKTESPYRAGRRGKDLSFRDWVQQTITGRKPHISNAYISTHNPGQPAIVMTAPVFDKNGGLTGMMTGSLDLLGVNFLAELSQATIGKSGYFYIIDTNRTMLVHPDKNRIMNQVPPGTNTLIDRAFNGFEGSGETVNSYGVSMLVSCKHLQMTSWLLAANYPASEAYAPFEKAQRYLLLATPLFTVMLLLATWFAMKRLMSPLTVLTRHVNRLTDSTGRSKLETSESSNEIGVLVTAFNTMMTTLDSQQESLKKKEAHYRAMVDSFDGLIYICSAEYRIEFMNEQLQVRTGYDATGQLCFKSLHGLQSPCSWCRIEQILAGESLRDEIRSPLDNRWYTVSNTPISNARGTMSQQALIVDITERKLAEDAMHDQAILLEQEVAKRQKAQDFLLVKQHQLEELNDTLERRVSDAVSELRHKDQLLIQQGRLAAMGEMINNIAHQWRQPLNNIGLIAQNLQYSFRAGELDAVEMDEQVERAMKILMHMSGTINDFRNFFREDKEQRIFTVNQTVASALNILLPTLKCSDIVVECKEHPEIAIDGFPNEYLQALLNILINARDVLLERRVIDPRIDIAIFREEDRAVVTVRDNGGGIAADVLPKIFDPYFTTKSQGKGTGIGLYMSKTIIEKNMSGSLTARTIDGGAEFRMDLLSVTYPAGAMPSNDTSLRIIAYD